MKRSGYNPEANAFPCLCTERLPDFLLRDRQRDRQLRRVLRE
ncbi:hypothetical protein RE628_25320 [Paenibacillus sp. D2_2]|nr:hypothetical protein [Paenibacillus sp. D2_2]WMT40473.1 hypothetical protein RE628_25320 [Paenibacillus sp. D2_2]